MTEQGLLEAASQIVGAPLRLRTAPGGHLLVPTDWARHRGEQFWIFVRQHLPLSPSPLEAALALIHLHGRWQGRRPQTRSKRGSAAAWLVETLVDNGPLGYADVRQIALQAGLAWDSVRRASQRPEFAKHKDGFHGGWVWSLANEDRAPVREWAAEF